MNISELELAGLKNLHNGEYIKAIADYEQCIEINPEQQFNYWQLGLANLLQGDELTAQSVWLSVLLQFDAEEYDIVLGDLIQTLKEAIEIQLQRNNLVLAEKICSSALQLNTNLPEIYAYLAICYRRQGAIENAIKYAKKAIELNPDFAEAYSSLGAFVSDYIRNQSAGGKLDEPISYLQKAIELNPYLAEAYYNLGCCFNDQSNLDKAIKCFQKAIDLKPSFAEAHFGVAMCFRNLGKIDLAIEKLEQLITIKPEFIKSIRAINELSTSEQAGYAPKIREGYKIWDAILFKDDNLYRLFYLMGDSTANPFWSVGEVGAAISDDLKTWQYIGVALKPESAYKWQSGRMLAGSIYKENGIYYFFYSASPPPPLTFQEGIGLAKSQDGISWQKSINPIIDLDQLDSQFYTYSIRNLFGEKKHFACRDPFLFKDEQTNNYYLFFTTSCRGKNAKFRGCIGLAVSQIIEGNYQVLPPVLYPLIEESEEGIFYEMERPQIINRDGKYHLFFSCAVNLINPLWIKQVGSEEITHSSLYWYISENITGSFTPVSEKPIVKGSEKTGLYGTSFIQAPNGQLIACGSNILTHTLEVSPRFPVRWENGEIEIIVD
ncbi:MAG: tetratricopeptide repeat protein [Crinalium sp.]